MKYLVVYIRLTKISAQPNQSLKSKNDDMIIKKMGAPWGTPASFNKIQIVSLSHDEVLDINLEYLPAR